MKVLKPRPRGQILKQGVTESQEMARTSACGWRRGQVSKVRKKAQETTLQKFTKSQKMSYIPTAP